MKSYRIGIDLGGTKIEIAAFDQNNIQIFHKRVATPKNNYEQTIAAIANLVDECQRILGAADGIGIGSPGAESLASGLMKNCNSICLNAKPFKKDLQNRVRLPIKLANDADCFTLSEAVDGAGAILADDHHANTTRSVKEPIAEPLLVFGVIIGTGVGGGLVYNKKLLQGPNRITGEWGHNPLPFAQSLRADCHINRPRPCYCGKQDCIETYLSGPAMAADFHFLTGRTLTAADIILSAADGDLKAEAVLNFYIDNLAKALAGVINILDPHVIVLGGGLSNIQALYTSVPLEWSRYVFSDDVRTLLRPARHGDSSGVRGAAWL